MAPEVIRNEDGIDGKIDVFSFSVVLVHLHNRITPYPELSRELSAYDLLTMVAEQGLRPNISNKDEPMFPELLDLITSCWSDNPLDRPEFHTIVAELTTSISWAAE